MVCPVSIAFVVAVHVAVQNDWLGVDKIPPHRAQVAVPADPP